MTEIVIAPFSHSPIRDWPAAHFGRLIGLLLDRREAVDRVRVIGTVNQRLHANEIVRAYPADRVVNECGRLAWEAVFPVLRDAACVIGNNSGIAHVAGHLGAPTVCVFGGSHQRTEWRPRGRHVVVLSRAIGCSPCQLDHNHVSPYGKACLREIAPEEVERAAATIMRRAAAGAGKNEPES